MIYKNLGVEFISIYAYMYFCMYVYIAIIHAITENDSGKIKD